MIVIYRCFLSDVQLTWYLVRVIDKLASISPLLRLWPTNLLAIDLIQTVGRQNRDHLEDSN